MSQEHLQLLPLSLGDPEQLQAQGLRNHPRQLFLNPGSLQGPQGSQCLETLAHQTSGAPEPVKCPLEVCADLVHPRLLEWPDLYPLDVEIMSFFQSWKQMISPTL